MKSEISALLDDELAPGAAGRTIDALGRDADLRNAWETYHLIGDALRRSPDLSPRFADNVIARLSREPVVFAPAASQVPKKNPLRFVLPLAASVMGMGAVGWVAMSLNAPQQERVARAPSPTRVGVTSVLPQGAAKPAAVQPATGALQEYLVAHQAYSTTNGIQGVAPYVRTVSEIHQGRRQ